MFSISVCEGGVCATIVFVSKRDYALCAKISTKIHFKVMQQGKHVFCYCEMKRWRRIGFPKEKIVFR